MHCENNKNIKNNIDFTSNKIFNKVVTKMTKSVIVKSQVKELAKFDGKTLSVAEEFYKALEEKNKQLVAEACKRAKQNSRNTVMARDL